MTIAWDVPGLPFTLSPSSDEAWTIDKRLRRDGQSCRPQ